MGIGQDTEIGTGDETAMSGNMHVCMEHGHGDVLLRTASPALRQISELRSPDDREIHDSALALKKRSSGRPDSRALHLGEDRRVQPQCRSAVMDRSSLSIISRGREGVMT